MKKHRQRKTGFVRLMCAAALICIFAQTTAAKTEKTSRTRFEVSGTGITALDFASPRDMLAQMEAVTSAGDHTLYFDPSGLFFAIKQNNTDEIFLSNPYNAVLSEDFIGNFQKDMLSQFVLEYTDSANVPGTLWSYSDCVALSQFNVYKIKNGVAVDFSVGKDQSQRLLPAAIAESAFEKLFAQLNDSFAESQMRFLYQRLSLEDTDEDKAALLKKYPYLKTESIFVLNDSLKDAEKDRLEEYFKLAGYTASDLKEENKRQGISVKETAFPNFKFTAEYTLTDKGFSLCIPAKSISFDRKSYNLVSIKALEYFGAQTYSEAQKGFMLIPDGSGAVAEFSPDANPVRQKLLHSLYGPDRALSFPETPERTLPFYLPVFGIASGKQALFGTITQGSAMSSLGFDLTGGASYYTASPVFTYIASEKLALEAKVQSAFSTYNTTVYDTNFYTGDYTVLYQFLYGNDASYWGMASAYRSLIFPERERSIIPADGLFVRTLGAVSFEKSFLGFSYKASAALTTFAQNKEIAEYFNNAGVNNLYISLAGWRKGGLDAAAANRFDPAGVLGGKRGLKSLAAWCEDKGILLFEEADIMFTRRNTLWDGFSPNKDAIRLMTRKLGGDMRIRPDRGEYDKDTFAFAVSPKKYQTYLSALLKKRGKLPGGVMLSSFGSHLNADYKKGSRYNREQALEAVEKALKNNSTDRTLAFDGANAYILPFASFLSDLPLTGSGYTGVSYNIPFVQLTVNGLIPYSGTSFNEQADSKKHLLACLSSGMLPAITTANGNIEKLKLTAYTHYNSIDKAQWLLRGAEYQEYLKIALLGTADSLMTGHITYREGVTRVSFDNGVRLYINATETAFTADGIEIPPMDYIEVG